uniref:Uncharacterized protein n=1 Tax=Triticum urartu TaxID=4572 RepID=A0A8R7TX05_TRIUA
MVPEKLLELRSSTSRSGSAATESGMEPLKWLKERDSDWSCCRPVKASAGTSPEKLLLERLRAVSDVRPAMLGGKAPARWLLERLSALRLRQPESAPAATSPAMRLPDRSRYCSPEQLVKSERPPEILFQARSSQRTEPRPAPTIQRRSASPAILLLDRSRVSRAANPCPPPPPPAALAAPTAPPDRFSVLSPAQEPASAATSATEPRSAAFPERSSSCSLPPHLAPAAAASAPLTLAPRRLSLSTALSCSRVFATARKSALSATAASESDVRRPPRHTAPGNLQAPSRAAQPSSASRLGSAALKSSSSCASSAAAAAASAARKRSAAAIASRRESMWEHALP